MLKRGSASLMLLIGDEDRSTRTWTSPRSLCLAAPDRLPAVSPTGCMDPFSALKSLGSPNLIGEEGMVGTLGWKRGEDDIVLTTLEAWSRGRSCP